MKKINLSLIAGAILCVAISCEKEPQTPVETLVPETPEAVITVIKAGFDNTKTVLDGQKVYWTDGDAICVNGVSSEAVSLTDPSASAEFTFNASLDGEKKAVYPASAWASDGTITIPANQDAGTNTSFATGALPLVAYAASGNELTFKHIGAVIKLQLKKGATSDNIDYVEFSGNNDEQVSGAFGINYSTGELTPASTAEADKTLRVSVGKALSDSEATCVYIAVPAINFSSGFKMKVIDVNGVTMTKRVGAANLKKGGIYPTPVDTFDADNTIKAFVKSYVNILKVWENNVGTINRVSVWAPATTGDLVADAHYIPASTTITVGETTYGIADMWEIALRSYLLVRGKDGNNTSKIGANSFPDLSGGAVGMSETEVPVSHGFHFNTPLIESSNGGYFYKGSTENKTYHVADTKVLDNWAQRSLNWGFNNSNNITNFCGYNKSQLAGYGGCFSSGRALITYAFFFKYMLDNGYDKGTQVGSDVLIRSELFGKEGNY